MRNQLLRDSATYFSASVIVQGLSFAGMILLMNYFSIAEYGQYTYIIEFIAIFAFFSDGGFNQYIISELSRKPELKNAIYGTAQAAQLVISGGMLLLILLTAWITNTTQNFYYLTIFGSGMVLNAFFTPMVASLTATGRADLVLYKDIINSIFKLGYIAAGIFLAAPVEFFLFTGFINFILTAFYFIGLRFKRDFKYFFSFKAEWKESEKFIRQGLAFTILMMANVIYNKIDIVMLNKMAGSIEVGYYAGATRFIYPFMFISGAFMTALFPKLVKHSNDPETFKKIQYLALYYLGIIGVALSAILFLISPLIFHTFFKDKFDRSIPVFNILVWYLAIVFIYGSISNNLVAKNKITFLVYLNVAMILLNITINFFMIPAYGATGAAISTITCEAVILITSIIYWKYKMA